MGGVAAPDAYPPQGPHERHRLQVREGLHAGAQEAERRRVGAGQGAGGHPRHGRGADGGDGARVHDGEEPAALGLEEQDRALVRVEVGSVVAREHGDDLDAEGGRRGEVGGHGRERALAARQHQHLAQGQQGLAAGEGGQRFRHDGDALLHREQPAHGGLIDYEDLHRRCAAAS